MRRLIPKIPEAVIPGEDEFDAPAPVISPTPRRHRRQRTEEVIVGEWRIVLEEEPPGPPRPVSPDAGAWYLGPIRVSAKLSLMLIFWAVLLCNLLLGLGVILAMLHRAGRL